MRKIIVLVEVFALAAIPVTAIAINPQTAQMMVAASQVANPPAGEVDEQAHCLCSGGWHRGSANNSSANGEAVASMIAGRDCCSGAADSAAIAR